MVTRNHDTWVQLHFTLSFAAWLLQKHMGQARSWVRRGHFLTRPMLGNHLWHLFCQHCSVWMFSCVGCWGFFVCCSASAQPCQLLQVLWGQVISSSCTLKSVLDFVISNLRICSILKYSWPTLDLFTFNCLTFTSSRPLILLAFPPGLREFVLQCLVASWDSRCSV